MDHFENDQGFTETFNQSALRYRTNLVNSLFRGFFKWQARTLLAELRRPDSPYANCKIKGLQHFLVNAMSRAIVRANPVQPELYSSLYIKNYQGLEHDPFCLEIVQRHSAYLTDVHANDEKLHPKLGFATEKMIERMPHLYLGYALFLQKETGRLEALVATPEKRARLPFQVIPQLTMKERCIDFGKEQITELVKHMASGEAVYKGRGEDQHLPVKEWVRRLFETDRVPTVIEKAAVVIEKQQEALARLLLQKAKNETYLQRAKMNPEKLKQLEKKMAKNGDDLEKKTNQLEQSTKAQQKRISKSTEPHSIKKTKREADIHPDQPAQKKLKIEAGPVWSRSDWSAMVDVVARKIFSVPARVALRWTGTVTTDGVRAHWHCLRGPLGGLEAAKKLKTSKNRQPKDAKKKKTVKKRKRTDRETTYPEQDHSHTLNTKGDEDAVLVEALRSTGP
jgi:hypothetical protein